MSRNPETRSKSRRRILVEPRFQFSLLGRLWIVVAIAMVLSVMAAAAYSLIVETAADGEQAAVWPGLLAWVALAVLILLGLLVWASLILTNRIAGPIYRLMRVLDGVAKGRFEEEMHLRRNDAFHEVADQVNVALESLRTEREETRRRLRALQADLEQAARDLGDAEHGVAPPKRGGAPGALERARKTCSELTGDSS